MTDQCKNSDEPDIKNDADPSLEETLQNTSDVTKSQNPLKSKLMTIGAIAGVGAVLMTVILSGTHSHKKKTEDRPVMNQQNFDMELKENMAALKKIAKSIPVVQSTPISHPRSHTESKAMLARQNAPSSLYTADYHLTQMNNQMVKSTSSSTFAGSGSFSSFGNQQTTTSVVEAQHIAHPDVTIASGEFMHAALETAISSDLPGMVRAVVSQPVYAYTGEKPLIPAGSRLIGQYSSAVMDGQNRVMVIWNRVVLPNGISVQINSPGTGDLGIAGQGADSVDHHFFARFGQAALLSLIGAGAATMNVNPMDQYNSASEYRSAIAQSFQQSATNSLQNNQSIKNTLHVYQGAKINVFVAHDLSFFNVMRTV